MPDWNAVVRSNLQRLDLTPQQQEEIVSELATHLEDDYEQLLAEGLSEAEAFDHCIEAAGWRELGRNIRRAKEDVMNHRVKTLWLPGLATFLVVSLLLMLSQRLGIYQPRIMWKEGTAMVLYLPWLMMLPLCGAAGAYMSLRAGGTRLARIFAGLFPATVMFAMFCLILPISIVVDHGFVLKHPVHFVLGVVNWVGLPALLLLLGAAPLSITPTRSTAVAR